MLVERGREKAIDGRMARSMSRVDDMIVTYGSIDCVLLQSLLTLNSV